jgi:hypothetical protein
MSHFYVFLKALPIANFTIASTALYIQGFQLLPWHNELDANFNALKTQRNAENAETLRRLESIEKNLNERLQKV